MGEKKRGWKVAVAGECMSILPFSDKKEPGFLKIKEIMEAADVCYAHLEMNLGDFTKSAWPARAKGGSSYMLADPVIAKELRWLGVDIMSTCHNHSYDWGAPGVLETIKHCREADIVCAGLGVDLEEAREPAYWHGEAGRAALVATSTGNLSHEWANLSKGSMSTRPGVNPLRIEMRYILPEAEFETLRNIGEKLNVLEEDTKTGNFYLYMPGALPRGGSSTVFSKGKDYGIDSSCDPRDLEGNLLSIKEARLWADFVMVAHHFNANEGARGEKPPTYARKFAHAAIDAGADMYVAHGWHKVLGFEIYKGKPIFYGLGNFFAQSQFVRRVPYDSYEAYGHDVSRLSHLRPSDEPLHPGMDPINPTWWTSLLFEAEYKPDGQIKAITFHPIEMGVDITETPAHKTRQIGGYHAEGRPILATGENAKRILDWLQKVSNHLGSEIKIDGDIGRWYADK